MEAKEEQILTLRQFGRIDDTCHVSDWSLWAFRATKDGDLDLVEPAIGSVHACSSRISDDTHDTMYEIKIEHWLASYLSDVQGS